MYIQFELQQLLIRREARGVSIAGKVALEFVIHLNIDRKTVEDKVKQWSFNGSDHQDLNLFKSMAVHCDLLNED